MTASQASDTPKIVHDGLRVLRDPDRGRYELWQDDQYIGFLGYTVDETTGADGLRESVVRLQHTIIDEKFGRRGYARALVTMVLPKAEDAARDIFSKYVTARLPLHPTLAEEGVEALIDRCVQRMYARSRDNEFVEVTYADGREGGR